MFRVLFLIESKRKNVYYFTKNMLRSRYSFEFSSVKLLPPPVSAFMLKRFAEYNGRKIHNAKQTLQQITGLLNLQVFNGHLLQN